MRNFIIISIISIFSLPTHASNLCSAFPENTLKIPVTATTGLSKQEMDNLILRFMNLYAQEVKNSEKCRLDIKNNWKSEQVNAFAMKRYRPQTSQDLRCYIEVYGGLTRHKLNSFDSTLALLCHELGHHIGGAPQKSILGLPFLTLGLSNEGQADYWSNLKCLKKVFKLDDNEKIMKQRESAENHLLPVSKIAKKKCFSVYNDKNKAFLCYRSAMAGYSLVRVLASNRSYFKDHFKKPSKSELELRKPSFEKSNNKVVRFSKNSHPEIQCRLDTYLAGSLCNISEDLIVSKKDPHFNTCTVKNGYELGLRPSCWFREKSL